MYLIYLECKRNIENKSHRRSDIFSLLSIIESTSACPVVFEMVERLKKEYGFKRRKYKQIDGVVQPEVLKIRIKTPDYSEVFILKH